MNDDLLTKLIDQHQKLTTVLVDEMEQRRLERRENQWVGLEEAAQMLGPAFSSRKLLNDIKEGHLKCQRHWIDTSNGNRPTYAVKVVALRHFYESPPDERFS